MPLLEKGLKYSPLVGVFGHRQVGKTTLVRHLSPHYVTLDVSESLSRSNASPESFLSGEVQKAGELGTKTVIIDECQFSPGLFPSLKEYVRVNPEPGRFLLTGSVRFSSRKAIRESLTGRLIAFELLPMSWAEMEEKPLSSVILRQLQNLNHPIVLNRESSFTESSYERGLFRGGLPGIFAVRDEGIRTQKFETQLNTILERDLKLILETSLSYRVLRSVVEVMAQQVGTSLSMVNLSRTTGVSQPTLRKILAALESLFLVRVLPVEGAYSKPMVFFEDIGEQQYLLSPRFSRDERNALLPFLYHHLRVQIHYRPEQKIETFCYRSRRGLVPVLCFRGAKGVLGLAPAMDESMVAHQIKEAESFFEAYPKGIFWVVTPQGEDQMISSRVRRVSLAHLMG